MRLKTGLVWAVLLLGGLFVYHDDRFQAVPNKVITAVSQWRSSLATELNAGNNSSVASSATSSAASSVTSTSSSQAASSATTEATPIESNVQGKTLATTYYYHFAADIPAKAQQAFTAAVAVYNQTGIVKLVAGSGTAEQNQITFFVYHKSMSAAEQGTVELGHGGPNIIQRVGWGAYTANHARAGLNATYSAALNRSVAIHELGHALGLDHSTDPNSVMYPVEQGKTVLTAADIAGLNSIYVK